MTPSVSYGARPVAKSSIRLEVLLTTGQRQTWDFRVPPSGEKSLTVEDVKERIFDTWPSSWPNKPTRPNGMRLLHLGHILTDPTPLAAPPLEGSTAEQADAITPTSPEASSSSHAKTGTATSPTTQSAGKAKAAKGNDQQTFSAPVVNRNLPLGKSTVVHLLMRSGSGSESGSDGQGGGDGAGTKRQGSKRQANRSDATTRDKEPSAAVSPPREQDVDQQHGAGSSSGGCRCVIC